jgi:hypothetical protein
MSGKVTDEDMFRLEKRIKKAEAIIACMTEEERTVPDLIARQVLTDIISSQFSSFILYLTKVTYLNSVFCCENDNAFILYSCSILLYLMWCRIGEYVQSIIVKCHSYSISVIDLTTP